MARVPDYRCITIAPTISSAKKIGSNTGGTSHSRRLALLMFVISDRPSDGGSATISQSPITAGWTRDDMGHMVTLD